jgi:hypothetical protein
MKKTIVASIATVAIGIVAAGWFMLFWQNNSEQKILAAQEDQLVMVNETKLKKDELEEPINGKAIKKTEMDKQVKSTDKTNANAEEEGGIANVPEESANDKAYRDYEFAKYLKAEYPNAPLVADIEYNKEDVLISIADANAPLEMQFNDIHAFTGAAKVIEKYCLENEIDLKKTRVGDLTEDQLVDIDELCFEASPHGK